jgi:hypothetical protein
MKLTSEFVINALFGAVLWVALPVFCAPPQDSNAGALFLAIRHFDPDHKAGIGVNSQETKFVAAALALAKESIPETSNHEVNTGGWKETKWGPLPMRSVSLQLSPRYKGYEGVTPLYAENLVENVLGGCYQEEKPPSYSYWAVDSALVPDWAQLDCTNSKAIAWLQSIGIESVTLIRHKSSHVNCSEVFLTFSDYVDPYFKANEIQESPMFREFFGDKTLEPFEPPRWGQANDIVLVEDPDLKGYRGIVLKFSYAGKNVVGRISWLARIKNLEEDGGAGPPFKLECEVVETGTMDNPIWLERIKEEAKNGVH